ncbi:MAG: HD domain-containing phosphohydrolase [Vicinamibacterales bacterium]
MIRQLRRSLVLKTAALFAAAALVPFVLAALFLFRSARNALYDEVVRGLDARVELMRDSLDARLTALRGNAVAWAGLEVMTDLLADDLDKRITVALEGLKRDYAIDGDIYVLSPAGRVVAASDAARIGTADADPRLSGIPLGEVRAIGLRVSPFDQRRVIGFAVPVTSRAVEGRAIGVLLLEYHVNDLVRTVLTAEVQMAAVVADGGVVVAATDRWAPELEHSVTGVREAGPFIVAASTERGAGDFPGFGWTVIGAAERDLVLAPVTRVERISLGAGIAGLLLLVVLVAAAAARAVRPLTAVSRAADSISRTMVLSHKVPSHGDDEIGQMAAAFNRMVDEVNRYIAMLLEANIEMLEVLGSAIAKRDSDTSVHNYRVTLLALAIAEAAGLDRAARQALVKGSFLHDVGKIAISDAILLKPGRLDREEFETMKTHVVHGTDIVSRYAWLRDALDIVRHHHERVDGTGYPDGLAGEAIPLNARIFAIADVFDALTSERPYKRAFTLDEALQTMRQDRGRHFDARLFDLFDGLAPHLYQRISQADPAALVDELRQQMRRSFFRADGADAPPTARG